MSTPPNTPAARPTRGVFLMMLVVLLVVLLPFLFWRSTWFGRSLTDREVEKYLLDTKRPRKTQHALVRIAERITRGDQSVKRWYPQVQALTTHENKGVRATVAWMMGQDNQADGFHQSLLELLEDSDPLVERNAALSLVRFADPRSKPTLRAMLQPYTFSADRPGTIKLRLEVGEPVNPGTLLARLEVGEGELAELRSPLSGRVQQFLVADGVQVEAGQPLLLISPAEEQTWEALRALYLLGDLEDLPLVERFARGGDAESARIRQQAAATAQAIRRRAQSQQEN